MSTVAARGPRRGERGFALVAVLWILVLLTAIVGEFAYSMRTEANIARNFKEATQAHYIARSGLLRAVAGLLAEAATAEAPQASEPEEPAWRPADPAEAPRAVRITFTGAPGGHPVRVVAGVHLWPRPKGDA